MVAGLDTDADEVVVDESEERGGGGIASVDATEGSVDPEGICSSSAVVIWLIPLLSSPAACSMGSEIGSVV